MKINKLKVISVVVCCFVASLWSEAKSMDNQPDILESATVNRTSTMKLISQSEINDLTIESKPSQIINLEDSETSRASFMVSPFKTTIQMAQEFIKIVTHNTQKGMIMGLILAYQVTAATAAAINTCNCVCMQQGNPNNIQYIGVVNGIGTCVSDCYRLSGGHWIMDRCQ